MGQLSISPLPGICPAPRSAAPAGHRLRPGNRLSPTRPVPAGACELGDIVQQGAALVIPTARISRARITPSQSVAHPFSSPETGVVQNQRFSGPHACQFAPSWATSKKTERIVRKVMENGAKWRFFEGLKRHFAVPGADCARSQPASLPYLTSVAFG